MTTRVYVEAAGCDRRQLDIQTIRTYLLANDYELVDDPAKADKIVVSTCAFKAKEEDESVRRLRSLRKYQADILVYGCLPDIAGERYPEFDDLPHVAPREIETIDRHFEGITTPFAEVLEASTMRHEKFNLVRVRRRIESGLAPRPDFLRQARALGLKRIREVFTKPEDAWYLFVSRGCVGLCSYCAIRRSIGRVQSKPIHDVVGELRRGLAEGYRTFDILGDDPGCYGVDIDESLPALLSALFDTAAAEETGPGARASFKSDTPIRFRIREIHPRFLVRYHEEMVKLPGFSRVDNLLCPVQSGSDRILALMQREHTSDELLGAIQRIRELSPDTTLDTQIIVGFPGETVAEFRQTLDVVKAGGFNSVVVFPYHDKIGTVASSLADKVAGDEIKRRMRAAFRFFRQEGIAAYYSCP